MKQLGLKELMISSYLVKKTDEEREKDNEGESDEVERDPFIPNTSGPKLQACTTPVLSAEP
jgi:hypothetical protein